MAVETTPLGFKKPDNTELVKFGAYYMGLNAQRSEELLGNVRSRLGYVEAVLEAGGGSGGGEPGAGSVLVPDPDNDGLYFIV